MKRLLASNGNVGAELWWDGGRPVLVCDPPIPAPTVVVRRYRRAGWRSRLIYPVSRAAKKKALTSGRWERAVDVKDWVNSVLDGLRDAVFWTVSPPGVWECRNDELGVVALWNPVGQEFWFTDSSGAAVSGVRYVYPVGSVVVRGRRMVWEGGLQIDAVPFLDVVSMGEDCARSYIKLLNTAMVSYRSDVEWAVQVQAWLEQVVDSLEV